MTDYVAIALQGFSTGIGVIMAHEFWEYFKKYRERVKQEAKVLWSNVNGETTRRKSDDLL